MKREAFRAVSMAYQVTTLKRLTMGVARSHRPLSMTLAVGCRARFHHAASGFSGI